MKRSVVALILSVLCFVRPWEAVAQEPPLWPGAKYDPAILRTLASNTTRYNDFKARVRSLPAPPRTANR